MGGSRSDSVDLEKGAAGELDDEDASSSDKDALIATGMSLAGLLLVLDVPILVSYGLWAALAVAIVLATVVVFVTWCVLHSGHYVDEDVDLQEGGHSTAEAEGRFFNDATYLVIYTAVIPLAIF